MSNPEIPKRERRVSTCNVSRRSQKLDKISNSCNPDFSMFPKCFRVKLIEKAVLDKKTKTSLIILGFLY